MKKQLLLIFIGLIYFTAVQAQKEDRPNPFDYGKMWTFENPPKEWFKEAYDFDPGEEWFDDVQKSSLRFASWCSASFVSADGLIMTNHHCSRDVVGDLQQEGENFDKQGFYATNLEDERRAEGLFVEQLIKTVDITAEVKAKVDANQMKATVADKTATALEELSTEYSSKAEWEGLRTQVVTYYSGGKYSLYGYKKYDDIRLVLLPELDLGFFGGDPDNFTYPRYNLDCTFWRAYDEDGNPLNTSENFFKFNPAGAVEGEPVFVVGNPGRTERYRTVAQLKYDRDYRYPMTYRFLKNRNEVMMAEYNAMKDDPAREFESQALLNTIANIANGMKAYGGIVGGLENEELFNRKVEMENYIKSKSPGITYWDDLQMEYDKLNPYGYAITHLSPSGLRGNLFILLHKVAEFQAGASEMDEENQKILIDDIKGLSKGFSNPTDLAAFKLILSEIEEDIYPGDKTLSTLLKGKTVDTYVDNLAKNSLFAQEDKLDQLLANMAKGTAVNDPVIEASNAFISKYKEAAEAFGASSEARNKLEQQIANQVFNVYGTDLPPDATFTARISDGVVKGYDYNGTEAPYLTTYYGLYDRHYSHGGVFPWSLPEKWLSPSLDLLKSPMNTVSTNDIIGGNSGSPLINRNKETVGLIFDGNIESLPGNFIFDEEKNRTVSVHAGGLIAAMKYIYKADRIVTELTGE